MGTVLSYVTRKTASSRIESDPFIESATSTEGMAASKPRDGGCISQDQIRRYSTALRDAQEFLDVSEMIMNHQRTLEADLEKCHERLRRFTEDHAARQSESNVENINSTNRPSALERNYEQFYDHERMDAVDVIENLRLRQERSKWTELDDKLNACLIFEESYEASLALRKNFLQGASLILASAPAIGAQYNEAKKKGSDSQFSIALDSRHLNSLGPSSENSLKAIMKETAENCDVDALVQRTMSALHKRQEKSKQFQDYNKDFLMHPEIKKYTEKCCKYTWKLVCQTPPYLMEGNLSLQKNPVAFNPEAHQHSREFTPSKRTSEYIHFVVWPGLFVNDESKRVIRKTEVILK